MRSKGREPRRTIMTTMSTQPDRTRWNVDIARQLQASHRLALRYGLQPADADDVCQDLAHVLLTGTALPSTIRSPGGWLYRTAVNLIIDRRRRAKTARQRTLPLAPDLRDDGDDLSPDVNAARRDEYRKLMQALRSLRRDERLILQQRYFDDMSPPAIATSLGLPLRTVERRLAQAKTALKRSLKERLVGPNDDPPHARNLRSSLRTSTRVLRPHPYFPARPSLETNLPLDGLTRSLPSSTFVRRSTGPSARTEPSVSNTTSPRATSLPSGSRSSWVG